MYKVGFVDDEINNFELFEKLVDWEENGFRIVWKATDGNEALQNFERERADLLLVDIQMPVMNGLEFVRYIRESDQDVQIILISAFNEFSYAQQAIRYGVQDYLLKPVSRIVLNQIITKVRERLNKQRNVNEEKEEEKRKWEIAVLKAFQKVRGEKNNGDYSELLQNSLFQEPFCFCRIYAWNGTEEDYRKISEEILPENVCRVFVQTGNREYFMAMQAPDIRKLYEQFMAAVENIGLKADLHGTKESVNGTDGILALKRMETQADRGFYSNENKIYFTEEFDIFTEMEKQDGRMQQCIEHSLYQLDEQELLNYVRELCERAEREKWNPESVKMELMDMLIYLKVKMKEYYGKRTFHLLRNVNTEEIMNVHKSKEILGKVTEIIKDNFEKLKSQMDSSDRKYQIVQKANGYVKENYSDVGLSVSEIADYVGLSKNYFLTCYKDYTESSIWDYVTEVRIEAAKHYLMSGQEKIGTVARMVGYESEYHFSRKFKEWAGVSPKEYRNRSRGISDKEKNI